MAGIVANSAEVTMVSTSADNTQAGYVTGSTVTLSTSPTGTTYSWGLAVPTASAEARSALSSATAASPKFTPDVAGTYTVTCVVDGSTVYVLRATVTSTAISQLVEAVRFSPKTDNSVPAPALGIVAYFSDNQDTWMGKMPSGVVVPLFWGKPGANLTDASVTLQVGDGNWRSVPTDTFTQNRGATLGTTGAVEGSWIAVARYDVGNFTYSITNGGGGGGVIYTFAALTQRLLFARYDGTNWDVWLEGPLSTV